VKRLNFFELNFTKKDVIVYQMADIYFSIIGSKFRHPIAMVFRKSENPKKTKYWSAFSKLYEIVKNDSNFNMYWYVEAQIKKTGKMVWPWQLPTKKAIENYHEYLEAKKVVLKSDNIKEILYALRKDAENIKDWISRNKKTISYFFEHVESGMMMSDGIYYAIMNFLSPYFLSISKSFWKVYNNLDEDVKKELPSEEELKIKRSRIKKNNVLKEKAKKYFGPEALI